jgi:hypothetical protein
MALPNIQSQNSQQLPEYTRGILVRSRTSAESNEAVFCRGWLFCKAIFFRDGEAWIGLGLAVHSGSMRERVSHCGSAGGCF